MFVVFLIFCDFLICIKKFCVVIQLYQFVFNILFELSFSKKNILFHHNKD